MKTQAPEKELAAYSGKQTAEKNRLHQKPYLKPVLLSSLKIKLGELLFYLQTPLPQNEQQNYWRRFETSLRKFYEVSL